MSRDKRCDIDERLASFM